MKKYDLEFVTEETNYGTNRNTMHKRKEDNLWKIII